MYIIILLNALLCVCPGISLFIEPAEVEDYILDPGNNSSTNPFFLSKQVNATHCRTLKKYYCGSDDLDETVLLIYGSKGWSFPRQNVNVTLSYPTANTRLAFPESFDKFIIVGFKVNLHLDGSDSRGYISGGGIYNDTITLTFLCSNISTLFYEFWLYGVQQSRFTDISMTHVNNRIC